VVVKTSPLRAAALALAAAFSEQVGQTVSVVISVTADVRSPVRGFPVPVNVQAPVVAAPDTEEHSS